MRNFILTLTFSLIGIFGFSQQIKLSEKAVISVLTVGPGDALNDLFGHNAFRIRDTRFDYCFDYGRFDFDAPGFYTNFAKGKLNYWVGISPTEGFIGIYKRQNRSIKEQVLNLTQDEKQAIFDYLSWNAKEENKYYLYDFFYDNCSTRPKDIVKETLDNTITFNAPHGFKQLSFRELIYTHISKNSWGSFGIDIALGSLIDRKATPEEHMFLPKNIYEFFAVATKADGSNLISKTNTLATSTRTKSKTNFLISPLMVFGILGLIIIYLTYRDRQNKTRTRWLDICIFTLTGIIGIVLLLLWFATDHSATAFNYNLLWAFTLNLFVIKQVIKNQPSIWFRKYLKLLVILLCLLTLHWLIGVQVFAIALIPLLIALLLRYLFLIRYLKNQ